MAVGNASRPVPSERFSTIRYRGKSLNAIFVAEVFRRVLMLVPLGRLALRINEAVKLFELD